MTWVEVDGAVWRWVHGLVIPIGKETGCKSDAFKTSD